MATIILNYAFGRDKLPNLSGTGTSGGKIQNATTIVPGPGKTLLGDYPKALDLGTAGKVQVALNRNQINSTKFCVRMVFKVKGAVTARQNLVESTLLPFSMFLDKGSASGNFNLVVSACPANQVWSGASTEFFKDLKAGVWYTADLVYDTDTLAVFIDGQILSVHAFPNGRINLSDKSDLFVGVWVDGKSYHFNGVVAALQLYDDIPVELEKQLDERRGHPEWFITYKWNSIRSGINLGNPQKKYYFDGWTGAYVQDFDYGLIMYSDPVGAAFELHGEIYNHYRRHPEIHGELGYLVSDEGNAGKPGSRKNVFSKGGIYWSPQTGAVHVSGRLYLDYEYNGEAAWIGLPKSAATSLTNGTEQQFEGARMYWKNGTDMAFEVHGAILNKFLATGGVNAWGYPVSNETEIKISSVTTTVGTTSGRFSEFERCTIYWSSDTGAFEVHGEIRLKYLELNGPLGKLGFPTSDEGYIPDTKSSARYNSFQNGSILWFGSLQNTYACLPFVVYLGIVDTKESESGWNTGQNDINLRAIIQDNGREIFNKKFGEYTDKNIVEINKRLELVIVPNDINRKIQVTIKVWDNDIEGDDQLGTIQKELNAANAWGFADSGGSFNSGPEYKINYLTWSVQPAQNITGLTPAEKWWGVENADTAAISWNQYAAAFRGVDSDPEWWDPVDWVDAAFYELAVKNVASHGNCFGMVLGDIYSSKGHSTFSMPLNRFTNWNQVVNEFNIRHQYQVGAQHIWWFAHLVLTGNTHDPIDIFKETRDRFNSGDNPVLCISQKYDFTGNPHCIMPIGWNDKTDPWEINVIDPNWPGQVRTLCVYPKENKYVYDGGDSDHQYSGSNWSGGRLYFAPFSVLDEHPRVPVWDAIMLLLSGAMMIVGSDTETTSLTDDKGNDLDAFGADALQLLKQQKVLENHFAPFSGFGVRRTRPGTTTRIANAPATSDAPLTSSLYLQCDPNYLSKKIDPARIDPLMAKQMLFGDLVRSSKTSALSPLISGSIQDRDVRSVLADRSLQLQLDSNAMASIRSLVAQSSTSNIIRHNLRGKVNGSLEYIVKNKLNQFRLSGTHKKGENSAINLSDLGTSSAVVGLVSGENKTIQLVIENKLGAGRDRIKISIDEIPVAAGKEVRINTKPGIAGLEILTTNHPVLSTVTVQTYINGVRKDNSYRVNMDGSLRIRPSAVSANNELKIEKIDNLFGQMVNSLTVKPG